MRCYTMSEMFGPPFWIVVGIVVVAALLIGGLTEATNLHYRINAILDRLDADDEPGEEAAD
jgi:hypothetical protein